MLLGKGYHRPLRPRLEHRRKPPERLSLAALDPGTLTPPARETVRRHGDPGLDIFGARPAVFGDFFTQGLAMPVYLRKKALPAPDSGTLGGFERAVTVASQPYYLRLAAI